MNPNDANTDLNAQLQARLKELPKVIQDAILSADVEQHLRDLATSHKLHLDQWQILEDEVMLTLLGFQQPEELEGNIAKEIGLPPEEARGLALDINHIVFEPIRKKLEQELEHPDAVPGELNASDAARAQMLDAAHAEDSPPSVTTAPVLPATPPNPAPEVKIARPTGSSAYQPGEASSIRKAVHDDPYREAPV